MKNSEIFNKLSPDAIEPKAATPGSSGYDLFASENGTIFPGEYKLVGTGISINLPRAGWEAQVRSRSGLAAKHGVAVLNAPGTIDSDYKGEIKVILINHGKSNFSFSKGDRIAQLVITKVMIPIVEDPIKEVRGTGGFGSTGV